MKRGDILFSFFVSYCILKDSGKSRVKAQSQITAWRKKMSAGIVLQQMLIIFVLIMVGYTACKKKIIPAEMSRGISALVVNICNPAILIRSVFSVDDTVTNENVLLAVAAGAVMYVLLLLFSHLIPGCLKVEKKWKNHYAMMCIFGNTGFIGIPLVSAVLGDQALIYVAVVNAYFNLIFYTYGIRLADGENSHFSWKNFLNAGNLSILITIFLFFLRPELPKVITSSVDYMADTTTFLAMVVIGISLAGTDLKDIFTQKKLYAFIALRFLAAPVVIGLVLRFFIHDDLIYGVMVLLAAVPVANLPLMRVEETGGDGQMLSRAIILSTILSVITIPVVVAFV